MNAPFGRYLAWFAVAAAIHWALLFGAQRLFFREAAYSATTAETVDLDLVDAAPESASAVAPPTPAPPPPTPDPVPPPPETKVEPPPEPEPPKPEFVEPNPNAKAPKPRPLPRPRSAATNQVKPATSAATTAATGPHGVSGAPTGGKNVRPDYLYNPHPAYPEESKTKGEQGVVMLLVGINEQGAVTSVSVRRSSGFPRLDSAAAEGVRSWRFRPARLAGFAVATTLDVPIHFSLSRQ